MLKNYIEDLKGCDEFQVKNYMLSSNYGYDITYKGHRFDLRHWLNLYGVDVDYWSIWGITTKGINTINVSKDTTKEQLISIMEDLIKGA